MTPTYRTFDVTRDEFRTLAAACRVLRSKIAKDMSQSLRRGFVPEPGRINISEARGKELAALMDRLGIK